MGARRRVASVSLACLATLISVVVDVGSVGGSAAFPLDPTFNASGPNPGLVRMQFDGFQATAGGIVQLADGSALVGLIALDSLGVGNGHVGLAKFRPNGTLDATFNPAGPVAGITDLTGIGLSDFAVDSHGRIVIAGADRVSRLLPDGNLDTSFVATCITPCIPGVGEPPHLAPAGSVYVPGRVSDISVSDNDHITVVSATEGNQPILETYITKLTTTGNRDLAFNAGGLIPGVLTVDDYGRGSLVRRADGSFLLVSLSQPARLRHITANGSVDPSFGSGGVFYPAQAHSNEQIWSVAIDGTDRFVVMVAPGSPAGPGALLRMGIDGSPDTSFGTAGRVELAPLGNDVSGFLLVQPDHRLVVEYRHGPSMALARLTADGHLDASFNRLSATPGWLPIEPAPDANHRHQISSLVVTRTGALLAAGGRSRNDNFAPDNLAEIYRFDGFLAAPQPIAPYPIDSPPPFATWITSVGTAASAGAPAVRLRHP